MDGLTELARYLKGCDNPSPYTPMLGKIMSLPDLKIRLGSRIILTDDEIKMTFDLYDTYEHDGHTEYKYLNKEVVLLPLPKDNKFIAIGVIQ